MATERRPGYKLVFTKYITLKNGKRIYASAYGLQSGRRGHEPQQVIESAIQPSVVVPFRLAGPQQEVIEGQQDGEPEHGERGAGHAGGVSAGGAASLVASCTFAASAEAKTPASTPTGTTPQRLMAAAPMTVKAVSGDFPDQRYWGIAALVLAAFSFLGWRGKVKDRKAKAAEKASQAERDARYEALLTAQQQGSDPTIASDRRRAVPCVRCAQSGGHAFLRQLRRQPGGEPGADDLTGAATVQSHQ